MKKYILMLIGMIIFIFSDVIAEEKVYKAYSIEYSQYFGSYVSIPFKENLNKKDCLKALQEMMKLSKNDIDCKQTNKNTIECSVDYPTRYYCIPIDIAKNENRKFTDFINNLDNPKAKNVNNMFPFD